MSLEILKKEKFNAMDTIKQVEYINDMLKSNSLTKICKEIGISRSALRERFKNKGYIFNKDNSKYEIEEDLKVNINHKHIKGLLEDVECLKRQIKTLNEKIEIINTNNTINTNKSIKRFDGEIVSRAFKIDKEVQQDFKIFCKKHSEYRVSDILSSIIKDFLNNNR